ncbi:MAG: hypothetical protein AAGD14_12470 [Planctomycetota bacterium]
MRHLAKHLSCALLIALTACGGGDRDDIEPPIIIQTNTLSATVQIDTFATVDGTLIAGPGEGAGPFAICGRIEEFSAYRTDTELVFRIKDELGFCWDNDVYSVWIQSVTWRGVPNTTIILRNLGDPSLDTTGQALIRRNTTQGVQQAIESAIEVTQQLDDPMDGFFYLKIPLDLFQFATENDDGRSVFSVFAEIDRFPGGNAAPFVRDFTTPVNVDFVDPQ